MNDCHLILTRSSKVSETTRSAPVHHSHPTTNFSETRCRCASSIEEVESAWGLVYDRYSEMKLIDTNPFGIHAASAAVGPHAHVILGSTGSEVDHTITLFDDGPAGLPLDSVYPQQLDALRRQGRRLQEVGMLADHRRNASSGVGALFRMMRWAIHHGMHGDLSDIVIGVHPRHAKFYERCYGLKQFAEPTRYPLVRNHPVVLLRLRLREQLTNDVLPRGLADACEHPIPASAFSNRFRFAPQQLRGSVIASFIQARYGIDLCKTIGCAPDELVPV